MDQLKFGKVITKNLRGGHGNFAGAGRNPKYGGMNSGTQQPRHYWVSGHPPFIK